MSDKVKPAGSLGLIRSTARATALCCGFALGAEAWAQTDAGCTRAVQPQSAPEKFNEGWVIFVDNDALALSKRDRDYTGGLALTLAGARASQSWYSLDPLLKAADRSLGLHEPCTAQGSRHAMQWGVVAFTPGETRQPAVTGDRPYASLVYLANSRLIFTADPETVLQSTLAVGLLGLDVAEGVGRWIHSALNLEHARGWDRQISDGGEPTFRYTLARLDLLAEGNTEPRRSFQIKHSGSLSVGYLTEATTSLSLRWGKIMTPWWSFMPERAEYIREPAPVANNPSARQREIYGWGGIKARARLYNAFLQGQFRDSALAYDYEDIRPLIGEAWLGITAQIGDDYGLSWVVRYQTSELRTEPGDRDLFWGSVFLSRSF